MSNSRVFDPLDLEIIDRVYEAVWAQVEAREPFRDKQRDEDRQEALKRLVFDFAASESGHIDFDDLYERVLSNIARLELGPEPLRFGSGGLAKPDIPAQDDASR